MENPVIALIGAGNIGSRHLQGLAGGSLLCDIHVVEPNVASAALSRERFETALAGNDEPSLRCFWHNRIQDLPHEVAVAVIATGAGPRRSIVEQLIGHATIQFLVLEKFLFQKISDYQIVETLLQTYDITAFVNTPRRCWPGYKDLKSRIPVDVPIKLVAGTTPRNGLATNAIHMVDLLGFLAGDDILLTLDGSQLRQSMRQSRHAGSVEFDGILSGRSSRGDILLYQTYAEYTDADHLIVDVDRMVYRINEGAGVMDILKEGELVESVKFPILLQSDLTGAIVSDLLQRGGCDLPTYKTSSTLHLQCLQAFLQVDGGEISDDVACNIT